jgi:serine/threonine protein phosphatase 1
MNWIIGDVHGMYASLRRLLDAVDLADPSAKLTFAGDYVNRGHDSKKVIDHLLTLKNARFARGNHDDIFDLILHGHCFAEKAAGGTAVLAFQWFMDYGLDRTFHSYGLEWQWLRDTAALPTAERMAHLVDVVPAAHRAFIHGLPVAVEDEHFFVVHGYWPPTEPCYPPTVGEILRIHNDNRQQLLWGRYRMDEIDAQKPWGKRGFFGHTPIHTYFPNGRKAPMIPLGGPQLTLLDTACAVVTWGRLTAFCVEENRYLQSSHFGEMVDMVGK